VPNAIKYNVSNQTLALKKGNFYIGTGDVGKGPTSSTDYYNGITPPSGGYTIYLNKASGGPSIYTVSSNPQLTGLTSTIAGQTLTTVAAALDWYNSQTDKMIFNIDYPAVVTSGLTLNLDAGFTPSYPTTGATWYDVSSSVANGTLVGNPVFSTGINDFGGCFIVDTDQKYINLTTSSIFTNSSYTIETWQEIDSIPIPQRNAFRTSISVVGQGPDFTGKIISIQWYTGNQISVVNQGQSEIASTSDAFSLNTWCQVVFTYNYSDNNGILYINGVQNASGAFTPFVGTNPTIQLGTALTGCENCTNWSGSYAINRFYNRVLSASEVLQNYNAEITQQNLLSTEYQAILDYATSLGYTLPSTNQRIKQNKLLIDLKKNGIWEKLDTFAMFATDGDSNFALIDWKRLVTYTAVNSPIFTTNQGFKGDNVSAYIDTNFNIQSGTNYTLNNASKCYWVLQVSGLTGGQTLEGTNTFGYNRTQFANNTGGRINSNNISNITIFNGLVGFTSWNRTSSVNITHFKNLNETPTTQTSTALINSNQYLFRDGTGYGGNRNPLQFYSMGASLISENTLYYNTINTYLTSL
jgi:hypothetical protein